RLLRGVAVAEKLGQRDVVPELFLALAYHKLEQPAEARRWRDRAFAWLDTPRLAHQAVGMLGGGLGALPALVTQPPDPRAAAAGWEAWQEWQVLRSEVQKIVR